MDIKDIVDQEKQRALQAKVKSNQDKHIRKIFLKDCYKMWKDYKQVENPYTWWLGIFSVWHFLLGGNYFVYEAHKLPSTYLEGSWFEKKWDVYDDELGQIMIKHRTNPNNEYVYL